MEIRGGSARHLIIIGFVGALLAGCGGGGSGGSNNSAPPPTTPPPPAADTQAPTVKINFPPATALTTTDSITVTGTATDSSTISSVTVNGVTATSSDGFANWTATVSLAAGETPIIVEAADDQGNSDEVEASIKNEVPLLNPNDIALDSAGNRALLVDEVLRAVVAVDLGTGQRSVLSDDKQGSGVVFSTPSTIALDSTNNRALVGDDTQIIAVNLATGDRSVLADLGSGNQALDLTLDEATSRVLVVTANGVLALPAAGGTPPSDFSTAMVGTGPPFTFPASIVVDPSGNRALVTDSGSASVDASVIAIDLSNGNRTAFASVGDNNGIDLQTPLGIGLSNDGSSALVTDLGSATVAPMIVSIDLASQARTVVSAGIFAGGSAETGDGQEFIFPVAIVADGDRSLVVDPALAAVFSVDATTGNRDIMSSAGVGGGIEFNGPFNIAYDVSNGSVLVTDTASEAIYRIFVDTGGRAISSDASIGSGPAFEFPLNIAIGDGQAFVTDPDAFSVFSVDLTNGNRTILSNDFGANKAPQGITLDSINNTLYLTVIERDVNNAVVGSEVFSLPVDGSTATPIALSGASFTNLEFAQNLIVDSDAGTAFVADTVLDQLFAVTLAGGDTSSLARLTDTMPTGFVPFQDVTLMGDQTVLVDSSLDSIVAIDTSSGDRSVISGGTKGNGIALRSPTGVAYATDRDILLVVDQLSFAIFAVEPTTGDRVIISRCC